MGVATVALGHLTICLILQREFSDLDIEGEEGYMRAEDVTMSSRSSIRRRVPHVGRYADDNDYHRLR